jgi:hypothetical protein
MQIEERTNTPEFNYRQLHKLGKITQALLQFLTTAKVPFLLFRSLLKFMGLRWSRRRRRANLPARPQIPLSLTSKKPRRRT